MYPMPVITQSKSNKGTANKKFGKTAKSTQLNKDLGNSKQIRKLRQRSTPQNSAAIPELQNSKVIQESTGHHPVGHEAFPDPYSKQANIVPNGSNSQNSAKNSNSAKPDIESHDEGDEEEDDEEYDDDEEEDEENDNNPKRDHEEGDILPLNFDDPPPTDQNYLMTNDHSLVIKQVSIHDQGNYTCGVRNPAGVRFSSLALLNVFGKISDFVIYKLNKLTQLTQKLTSPISCKFENLPNFCVAN